MSSRSAEIRQRAHDWAVACRAEGGSAYPLDAFSAGYRAAVADAVARVREIASGKTVSWLEASGSYIAAELEKLGE